MDAAPSGAGQKRSVGAKDDGPEVGYASFQIVQTLARNNIPDADAFVDTGAGQVAAIWAKCQSPNVLRVANATRERPYFGREQRYPTA